MRSLSAAVCEGGRALEIACLLSASLKSRFANVRRVYLPGHGPQIRFRIPTTKCSLEGADQPNHAKKTSNQSFAVSWKASLQVARLCEAQAIISPRLHRDGPPGYSVNDATDAFDCQHDLDGPWRERQREVGDCRKSVSSRKGRVLGECRECAGAR